MEEKTVVATLYLDKLALLDHNRSEALQKRALHKYYTNEILFPLINLNSKFKPKYWNTYRCCKTLLEDQGIIRAEFCKNRWCVVCNRIRTGVLINQYAETVQTWEQSYFVTLTKPKVRAEHLQANYNLMLQSFTNAWRRTKRKHGLTEAIRKTETTWRINSIDGRDYHTHFHILINGKAHAETLVKEWIKEYPMVSLNAQDVTKANDTSVLELFKYMTKMWKVIENEGTREEKRVLPYPPQVMDNIFKAFYRVRTVQTYGGLKPIIDNFTKEDQNVIRDGYRSEIWGWEQEFKTWVSSTGETLV